MRINKLFSNYGICSRKETNKLIEEKRVLVNGKLAKKGQWVEESDFICLDGKKIEQKEKIYIALNKPVGITCTASLDVSSNIIRFVDYQGYIFAVGRLDKDSQGLIILTNDGEFSNKILESDNNHEKEYIVTVDKEIDNEFIMKMESGVEILNTITRPCKIKKINSNSFNIILTQGLNRQIRRMCLAFGYKVLKLERIRIMNITIDGIGYGKYRSLTKEEVKEIINY